MDFEKTVLAHVNTDGLKFDTYVPRLTVCPSCKNGIAEDILFAYGFRTSPNNFRISVMFQCNQCFTPFICIYERQDNGSCVLIDVGPMSIQKHQFSKEIQELSSDFIDIYNQAYAAEQYGLNEVCGMAFRKALEFLLKTFLIKRKPDEEETIAKMPIGQCIKQYVKNERIQTTAERCVWLANDHAHYLNHHVENDLEDLKKLLRVVINWVENELIMDAAAGIPPKDPS